MNTSADNTPIHKRGAKVKAWHIVLIVIGSLIVIPAAIASSKDDDAELSPGDELALATWNAMTAQEQADMCASRSLLGEDVLYAELLRNEARPGWADGMLLVLDLGC